MNERKTNLSSIFSESRELVKELFRREVFRCTEQRQFCMFRDAGEAGIRILRLRTVSLASEALSTYHLLADKDIVGRAEVTGIDLLIDDLHGWLSEWSLEPKLIDALILNLLSELPKSQDEAVSKSAVRGLELRKHRWKLLGRAYPDLNREQIARRLGVGVDSLRGLVNDESKRIGASTKTELLTKLFSAGISERNWSGEV